MSEIERDVECGRPDWEYLAQGNILTSLKFQAMFVYTHWKFALFKEYFLVQMQNSTDLKLKLSSHKSQLKFQNILYPFIMYYKTANFVSSKLTVPGKYDSTGSTLFIP